ncbi:hypothetical protein ACWY4P_14310 [Streptomyces sp. LZ34]
MYPTKLPPSRHAAADESRSGEYGEYSEYSKHGEWGKVNAETPAHSPVIAAAATMASPERIDFAEMDCERR